MNIETGEGWQPGLIGWCVAEHGSHYAREWGFGPVFEAKVAAGMAAFAGRLDDPLNHLYWARDAAGFLATLSLVGSEAEDGLARLRWFFAAARARGQGLGGAMMATCVDQARRDGWAGMFLTTFAGLDAARRLYEKAGFRLVREATDTTWGTPVLEQRFEMRF